MKKYFLGAWLSLLLLPLPGFSQSNGRISSTLAAEMHSGADKYDVCILFHDQVDLQGLNTQLTLRQATLSERSYQVITRLQAHAASTQPAFLQWLGQLPGVDAASVRPYWVVNAIFVKADAADISRIAAHPAVAGVDLNHPVFSESYHREPMSPAHTQVANGKEIGLVTIGAPTLWSMGYTGYGRIAMSIDTGVDPEHPAFKSRYRGRFVGDEQAWFDPMNTSTTPNDCDGHGTHTVGTMVGLDAVTRDTIGVAFNGLWIASQGICNGGSTVDKTIAAFQWSLNPDNDVTTTSDMPDAINNSWFVGGLPNECQSLYAATLTALETAGIAVVFSAGNNGPSVSTVTPPKNINLDLVNSFCVGAVSGNPAGATIASFSSRGPSICGDTASLLIKPEVSAPGVSIRSSLPNGTYGNLSGTSMAAPHVAGAILLLKEAFPYLTGTQIKLALYFSATDLGAAGEDNDYGRGLINLPAAFQYLVNEGHVPVIPQNENNLEFVEVLNLPSKVCTATPFPVVVMKNRGTQPVTAATLRFTFDGQDWDTVAWSGLLPLLGTQPVVLSGPTLLPGNYEMQVEIVSVNNQPDDRPLDNFGDIAFSIATGPIPAVTPGDACQGARALLHAQVANGDVRWFTRATGGQEIGHGQTFLTPPLTADTAFYAEGYVPFSAGLDTIGRSLSPLLGSLDFNTLQAATLESVTLYSTGVGFAFVVLKDSLGQVVQSKSSPLQNGKVIVPLGFELESDGHYRLELSGTATLLSVTSGVVYPLVEPGVVELTAANPVADAYPGLFDWKIATNPACLRRRVIARVEPGSLTPVLGVSDTLIDLSLSESVQLIDATPGSVSRVWNFGDGQTDTSRTVIHRYGLAGTYQVTLEIQSAAGCQAADVQTVYVTGLRPTSISDMNSALPVTVYPNPNQGTWRLKFAGIAQQRVSLSLYDLNGKLVWQQDPMTDINGELVVSVGEVSPGMYALRWKTGNLPGTSLIQILD